MKAGRWRARRTCALAGVVGLVGVATIACGARYGDDSKGEPSHEMPAPSAPSESTPPAESARPPSSGATEWARTIDLVDVIEGDQIDVSRVAVASDGEIAIAGSFRGVLELAGQRLKSTAPGGRAGYVDTFVAKLSPSGELRWLKGIKGHLPLRRIRRKAGEPTVAFSPTGSIVLSSGSDDAIEVDGLRSSGTGRSPFVVELDGTTGKARWLTSVGVLQGSSTFADIEALDVRDGKVAIAGFADGTVLLAGEEATITTSSTSGVFLAVLDPARDGRASALRGIEGAALDEIVGLAIASDGAIVTAIRFGGPRLVVPGFVLEQTASGSGAGELGSAFDVALVAMTPNLEGALWAKSFGVASPQNVFPLAFALTPSTSSEIPFAPLLVGHFGPTYRFGSGAPELVSNGDNDVFFGEFSSTGEPVLAGSFGGGERDEGLAVAAFANRDLVVAGRYLSSNCILAGKVLPTPGPSGTGYVYLRSAATTADWIVTYGSISRADTSTVTSVAASKARDRVIAAGDFIGTIDLGSTKATSGARGATRSAFVTSIVH